jgi:hypothetical protein
MSVDPPKRDKFAALAQQLQLKQASSNVSQSTQIAPQGDKLAAMGAARSTNEDSLSNRSDALRAPRRDKLAAMGQRISPSTGEASLLPESPKQKEQEEAQESRRNAMEERARQRDSVWKDLERAEAATIKLLQLAQETAATLADATNSVIPLTTLSKNAAAYRDTLSNIHDWLSPHSSLVVAYQAPSRTNHVYEARVEWRLAEEKRALLQEFLRLHKHQESVAIEDDALPVTDILKRKRDE